MDLRTRITDDLKDAMRHKDADRLSTLRLINAAIKDQEIAMRGEGDDEVSDAHVLQILAKMVKQRQESVRAYEEAGRVELAEKERAEIVVIERYLPRPLDEDQIRSALEDAVARTGATSIRDMGRLMAELKARYPGQIDFGRLGPIAKERLSGPGV